MKRGKISDDSKQQLKDPKNSNKKEIREFEDPRFKARPAKQNKFVVDERFASMFTDPAFKTEYLYDTRGRLLPENERSIDDLKQYYRTKEDDESGKGEKKKIARDAQKGKVKQQSQDIKKLNDRNKKKSRSPKIQRKKGKVEEEEEESDNEFQDLNENPDESVDGANDEENEHNDETLENESETNDNDNDSDNDNFEEENDETPQKQKTGKSKKKKKKATQNIRDWMMEWPSSGESSEDEGTEITEKEIENELKEMDQREENVPLGDATSRLAVMNLDWDHIEAADLLALLSHFVPANGTILKVSIYLSNYGKEKLQHETSEAPDVWTEGIKGFDPEKLRKYELQKMRYYYAIVECDSVASASAIYESCDGMEIMQSSNFLDLRFVPEDQKFTEKPKSEASFIPSNYKAPKFYTKALQSTTISLTWDCDNSRRKKELTRDFTESEIREDDFRAYIASSSEASSDDEEEKIAEQTIAKEEKAKLRQKKREEIRQKYLALLSGNSSEKKSKTDDAEEPDDQGDMEITFVPGFSLLGKKPEEQEKNVFEQMMEKKREKRLQRKAQKEESQGAAVVKSKRSKHGHHDEEEEEEEEEEERSENGDEREVASAKELELLTMGIDGDSGDEDEDRDAHKRKGKYAKLKQKHKAKAIANANSKVDLEDPRFASLYENANFGIDPTDPNFVDTPAMKEILKKRIEVRSMKRADEEKEAEKQFNSKRKREDRHGDTANQYDSVDIQSIVERIKKKTKKQ